MAQKLKCPLSGKMFWCLEEYCMFWDPDMSFKGKTGNCLVVRAIQDLREIKEKIK